jgi:hypothetical protein
MLFTILRLFVDFQKLPFNEREYFEVRQLTIVVSVFAENKQI